MFGRCILLLLCPEKNSHRHLFATLHGEELEIRSLPATSSYEWAPWGGANASPDWTTFTNWKIWDRPLSRWIQTLPGQFPGEDDIAEFPAASTGVCVVDGGGNPVEVKNLSIDSHSSIKIELQQGLQVDKNLRIEGGTIAGFTTPQGIVQRGTLMALGGGEWAGGTFENINFSIGTEYGFIVGGGKNTMISTSFDVKGKLVWKSQDVFVGQSAGQPANLINILSGGEFDINAVDKTWGLPLNGAANPALLSIVNNGKVVLNSQVNQFVSGTAYLFANYTTNGTTELQDGTLLIQGTAEQLGANAQFRILNNSVLRVAGFGLRNGSLIGNGTIEGNLVMGYSGAGQPNTTPVLSPGGGNAAGTITVMGNFHLFSGELQIEIWGPKSNQYDRLVIVDPGNGGGNAAIVWANDGRTRKVFGRLMPSHYEIPAGTQISFMTYVTANGMNSFAQMPFDPQDGSWSNDRDGTHYWFMPINTVKAHTEEFGGLLWQGPDAQANTFVPGVDTPIAGGIVNLFDATGTTLIASTTTDANGQYEFDNLDPGPYLVQFDRASQERFVQLGGQSLADPNTGTVPVNVFDDTTDIDAGYFYDAAPIAVNDSYNGHINTVVTGNVLNNDSDPDNDTLTATLATGPQNGTVILNSNGSFVYTPSTGFSGQDSFTYTASDGYGGTATATVTITVASTSAPTSASVNYTTPNTLDTTTTDGVLAGASDPNSETLTAVLANGPANGTLTLNSDGSFEYVPNDNFVGTDSFSFYATDADGPGNLTTVSIQVTDNPPVANPVSPSTNQDTPLTFNVLTNDTDPDTGDTLTVVGVSNGVYGAAQLNADGTITYSPAAGWSGTDTLSYVISDSSGRLAESTVTVTVNPLPGAPIVSQGSLSTLQDNQVSIDLRTLVTGSQSSVDSLTYTLGSAANGMVSLSPDGYTAIFTPDAGYFGPASFGFLATDPANGIKTASSVSVEVLPTAGNVSDSTNEGSSVTISLPNNTSPDGDTLRCWALPTMPMPLSQ